MKAAFIDLDRTLLRRASGQVLNAELRAQGVVGANRWLPGERVLYGLYDRLGENVLAMAMARAAALAARGWSQAAVQRAGKHASNELMALIAPFAPSILAGLRQEGYRLVLSTTTPMDMVRAFAEDLGFDDVIATTYQAVNGTYTGRLEGDFVWGPGKLRAVRRWSLENGVNLKECVACSDSCFDAPLLSSVGHPRAVNPDPRLMVIAALRRWPIEHWDRPRGVPSIAGLEPYHLLRPFVREELFPYARFDIEGIENVPARGPALLAANHRSYFDAVAMAIVARRLGRPVRFLAKRELFAAPVLGELVRAIGGISVDRTGRPEEALRSAEMALQAGEVVIVFPQGTIPRGEAFYDAVLYGKTGTARLAASTGVPVIPIGILGSERVWPRNSRFPNVTRMAHPANVCVRVGQAVPLGLEDAVADTRAIMDAITALLAGAQEPSAIEQP
ncbi:MAG: HAD-IB family hydrolase [Actinobacteria bacterium]|nr:HAD-IB family hydrolase [Actinomycetota bacterium]